MTTNGFMVVDRPTIVARANGVTAALKQTLEDGNAVAFPINGEAYAVVRNRKASIAYQLAHRLNAAVRTAKSADGLSVLIWLEPK